ncbi:MAG: hypothetical protein HY879_13100 [Deltaproteobacteria bacterium]|nr:hypothetical protein [Deltaproteobacteria bacterium]
MLAQKAEEMTKNVDGYYGVTVIHGEKVGARQFRARAYIFRRDTQEKIGNDIFVEKATMNSADTQAFQEARNAILMMGVPEAWSGPEDGFRS